MKSIEIKIKPNQPVTKILEQTEHRIRLAVSAPAREGKANQEVIKFLSKYFRANVELVRGRSSRTKIVKIW